MCNPNWVNMEVGKNIKLIRRMRNKSQTQLSQITGLNRAYISQVECGKKTISLINLKKIADALKWKLSDIVSVADPVRRDS